MSLGLVIPLLDEAALVRTVVADIVRVLQSASIDHTLVLVDNGSRDETGNIVDALAEDPGIKAVHLSKNAGYGGGILAGLDAMRQAGLPEIVGWCWGDGQVPADVLPPLYRACEKGAPMAKALRTERYDGVWRRLVSAGYAATMQSIGCDVLDVNGCPKLMRREMLEALAPRSQDWFLDAEVVLGARALGWNVAHHPTVMRAREAGTSKVHLVTMVEFAWNIMRWRATNHL